MSVKKLIIFWVSCFLIIMTSTIVSDEEKPKKTTTPSKKATKIKTKIKIKITENIPYLDVYHGEEIVRIQRIQDIDHKITNSYARTSRNCPPFCIRPIQLPGGVKTVGEIELLTFLKEKVSKSKGLLIDSRLKDWHIKGTIPGSVSIPFPTFLEGIDSIDVINLFEVLGAKEDEDDEWNFDNAVELMLFCNGPWCGQSPRAIKNLLKLGYPKEKIYWYRGGMQAWQLFGLTTIRPH